MISMPVSRTKPIVVLLAAAIAGGSGASSLGEFLLNEGVKRITISGNRVLGYHSHKISGDDEAFNSLNYYGRGSSRFTDFGQAQVIGKNVFGIFNFQADVQDNRYNDPQAQRFSMNYKRGGMAIDYGDINGSLLNTNKLASFSKALQGISAGYAKGPLKVKALHSESKGSARTIAIQGNNSSGPYFLQGSLIVRGSESVRVDGQEMRANGKDYVINYEQGTIVFVDRVVSLTSTILISFESYGYNQPRGLVEGLGASYDFGKFGRVGVTGIQQKARTGSGTSSRLEKFEGFLDSSSPYFLSFEPAAGFPVIIKVNGVLQIENVDYHFNPDNPAVFYFNRFMPKHSLIDVIYTPKPQGTADGDRETLGFDYRLPLGERGSISYYQATGRLTNSVTPRKGTAKGAELDYLSGQYCLSASFRDVPKDYVSVETRGFNRNERSNALGLEVRSSDSFSYGILHQNSAVQNPNLLATGFYSARSTSLRGFATLMQAEKNRWNLEHVRTKSRNSYGSSSLDATTLTSALPLRRLLLTFGLDRQQGSGPVSSGSTTKQESINLFGGKIATSYQFGQNLSAEGSAQVSQVRLGDKSGTGRDYALSAVYAPKSNLNFTSSYRVSESGALATLGQFQNGYGLGYGGNGFSGGTGSPPLTGGVNLKLWQLSADYEPSERISLNAGYYHAHYSGSVTSNSDTRSVRLGIGYDLGSQTRIDMGANQSQTSFVDSPLKSSATALDLRFSGSPGRLTYGLGSTILVSGGNSSYKQDSSSWDAFVSYALADRHAVRFDCLIGSVTGYLPQDNFDYGLTYQYRIFSNLALNASYRWRRVDNKDPLMSSGAYRSSGFDLELAFDFNR